METFIPQWLMWIGSGVGAILTLVFSSQLAIKMYARRNALKDASQAQHATNEGKFIDGDQEALRLFVKRVEQLEVEMKEIRADHNSLMVENERLKTDSKHAEKEMERQAIEIKSLRERNHKLSGELQTKNGEILKLNTEMLTLRSELELLKKEVHRGE